MRVIMFMSAFPSRASPATLPAHSRVSQPSAGSLVPQAVVNDDGLLAGTESERTRESAIGASTAGVGGQAGGGVGAPPFGRLSGFHRFPFTMGRVEAAHDRNSSFQIVRPSLHELSPGIEKLGSAVRGPRLIIERVSQRGLNDRLGEVRVLCGPIPEGRPPAVHR